MAYRFLDNSTPCPGAWKRAKFSTDQAEFELFDDDNNTVDIDITKICSLHERNKISCNTRKGTAFTILEDVGETKRTAVPRVSSMFAQPAQRLPKGSKVAFIGNMSPKPKDKSDSKVKSVPDAENSPKKQPTIQRAKSVKDVKNKDIDPFKRARRRNTIYIPSDVTNITAAFLEAFDSPDKKNTEEDIGYIGTRAIEKRRKQKSPIPARRHTRGPLESTSKVPQESTIKVDVAGKNTGKENVPPGQESECNPRIREHFTPTKPSSAQQTAIKKVEQSLSILSIDDASGCIQPRNQMVSISKSPKPRSRLSNGLNNVKRTALGDKANAANSPRSEMKSPLRTHGEVKPSPIPRRFNSTPTRTLNKNAAARLSIPSITSQSFERKYPTSTTSNVAVHEEHWLSQQEKIITQLSNTLFGSMDNLSNAHDCKSLGKYLLEKYQDTYFTLLYKRIHASLLYGELRVPQETLLRGNRPRTDVGLRRKFLNLWLETYDINVLCTAAETVVGRQLPVPHSQVHSPSNVTSEEAGKVTRRSVESFLDIYLLKNEDMQPVPSTRKAVDDGVLYRRTILRSLMIIILLDKAKTARDSILPHGLFKAGAEHKASATVIQALGSLLNPSVGDFARPMSRLDCQVSYQQHSLVGYEYKVNNMAVDFRDGVLIARATELLFADQMVADNKKATTPTPAGKRFVVFRSKEGGSCPLSQRLRVPCATRATKISNVQISLAALSGIDGISSVIKGIRAEDIVDGYREKTVALLWAIFCGWGLPVLVDWEDVRNEIARLEKIITKNPNTSDARTNTTNNFRKVETQPHKNCSSLSYPALLHVWATHIARVNGLKLHDDGASLADGRVFGCILNEYEHFIRSLATERHQASSAPTYDGHSSLTQQHGHNRALECRLLALGCSNQFASIIAPTSTSGYTSNEAFNLIALTFLASRLLPASQSARAVVRIQRAWRHVLYVRRKNCPKVIQ
ncbi:hypothetical protein FQN57_004547 [Myotisia sp. PD_48]|nr:hypothetical protein FQN57_004547 [Myotisia sp. PD_48]